MKKGISLVSSIIIILSCITPALVIYAKQMEVRAIEHFSDKCVEIAHEYDNDKNFVVVDEEIDELDDLQFQTARLFVKTSSDFNKMGAEEVVNGFLDWHLLQYDSENAAKKAYKYYSNQSNIKAVEPDIPIDIEINDDNSEITYISREKFDNDYAKNIMGTNDVLAYINKHNIKTKKVRIGVIDTGIDYNHEIFKDRLFRTYFNATDRGISDDEYDIIETGGHGTMTTSCVVSTTPDSVEVGCYKTTYDNNDDYNTMISWIISAILKAYSDDCSVINMSFFISVNSVFQDALDYIKNQGVTAFVSAGNTYGFVPYKTYNEFLFNNCSTIPVGSTDFCNRASSFSNASVQVKFSAPGEDVAVACPNNKYRIASGTSFSSPFAAGIFTTLLSLNRDFSNEKLIDLMQYTSTELFDLFWEHETWYGNEYGGSGVVDAFSAFCELMNIIKPSNVTFSKDSGDYRVGDTIELYCDNAEIYYTTDLTIPNKDNGTKYTQPIALEEDTVINAIAYSNDEIKGQSDYRYYFAFQLGTDDMFTINDSGTITGYTGTITNLEIPETINGTTVKSIHCDLFDKDDSKNYCDTEGAINHATIKITSLKLPDTVEYIEEDPVNNSSYINNEIEIFIARGLKKVNKNMFNCAKNLVYVELPNVERVDYQGFKATSSLYELSLPACTSIGDKVFESSTVCHLLLPSLKVTDRNLLISNYVFWMDCKNLESTSSLTYNSCSSINDLIFDELLIVNKSSISGFSGLSRIEFSKLKSLLQFPVLYDTPSVEFLKCCHMVLPYTLKDVDLGNYKDKNKKTYIVYASKGSYAEQWAKENNIEFVELNSETAIYTDVRETCNKYTETLFFDALGFNKQYQWYGSFDGTTENSVVLEGATKELINLHNYKVYPYYFCKCISTDISEEDNYNHEEIIYSTVCKNEDYPSEVSEIEHDLKFINYSNEWFNYKCVDCGIVISKRENELPLFTDYVNTRVVRSNDNMYLDVVPDGIINAKDFAKIRHLSKYGW